VPLDPELPLLPDEPEVPSAPPINQLAPSLTIYKLLF